MVSISVARTSGWSLSSLAILDTPLSSTSRAVTELPRASPGSETLNSSTRKAETRWAVARSFRARSRSRATRCDCTAIATAKPTSSSRAASEAAAPSTCRRTSFPAR